MIATISPGSSIRGISSALIALKLIWSQRGFASVGSRYLCPPTRSNNASKPRISNETRNEFRQEQSGPSGGSTWIRRFALCNCFAIHSDSCGLKRHKSQRYFHPLDQTHRFPIKSLRTSNEVTVILFYLSRLSVFDAARY
jgi:hypothetical protein